MFSAQAQRTQVKVLGQSKVELSGAGSIDWKQMIDQKPVEHSDVTLGTNQNDPGPSLGFDF